MNKIILKRKKDNIITSFPVADELKRNETAKKEYDRWLKKSIKRTNKKNKQLKDEANDIITISKGQLLKILKRIPDLVWRDVTFDSIPETMYKQIIENKIDT